MINKKDLMSDLKFCQTLMNRLVNYASEDYKDSPWDNHHTVIQSDIRRLRRELNEIHHKLEWNYKK